MINSASEVYMYFLKVESEFSAALYLSNCDDSYKGMHGHDFDVIVTLYSKELKDGMVYDYTQIKSSLNELAQSLDLVLLNDKPPFSELNPTVESIAKYFYDNLIEELEDLPIYEVEVIQTKGLSASFRPNV
ncbi:6-carboxytetrahydropterin synthase [Thiospirochaeta perfilievii]|uniref:6-carboxy-5,6,7,8-tetrahydropterin synthase n=1 Tax=Thiospirochaeta perfilievii TaxID=252967 RepID=A0A5C1Q9H0_9SPIO|nr:6-carboxytetrahydropterin synthase [Thiospirochaeta perfilievii]QEN04131.1 6-carboxytetrahydropterin synthase [Thiospirochaeta perfilievii]